MVIDFINKIYADTNIPDLVPGTSGEHLVEFYTACSRGLRLNKKVVIVKPDRPLNHKVYDIIPEGVILNIVKHSSLSGIKARIILWIASGFLIKYPKKHIYSYLRSRLNKIVSKMDNNANKCVVCSRFLNFLKVYIDAKFFNKKQYIDKKEISEGVSCKLSNVDITYSQKYLRNIGVDFNKKIVCLHVRDHINDTGGYNRRCSIEQYERGIKYLESKDFLVIKIGRNSETKYSRNSAVDLSFDDVPHVIQIYLISICKFVISYQTGVIPLLSYMFNRPLLMANVVDPVLNYPIKKNALIILKTLYSKNSMKEARFDEITSGRVTKLKKSHCFDELYYYEDNTPSEILLSIKEMINFIDNGFKKNDDQLFLRRHLQEKNTNILKDKKDVGVYNFHMRWSGGEFIGAGALCAWYAKKIRSEIESYSN